MPVLREPHRGASAPLARALSQPQVFPRAQTWEGVSSHLAIIDPQQLVSVFKQAIKESLTSPQQPTTTTNPLPRRAIKPAVPRPPREGFDRRSPLDGGGGMMGGNQMQMAANRRLNRRRGAAVSAPPGSRPPGAAESGGGGGRMRRSSKEAAAPADDATPLLKSPSAHVKKSKYVGRSHTYSMALALPLLEMYLARYQRRLEELKKAANQVKLEEVANHEEELALRRAVNAKFDEEQQLRRELERLKRDKELEEQKKASICMAYNRELDFMMREVARQRSIHDALFKGALQIQADAVELPEVFLTRNAASSSYSDSSSSGLEKGDSFDYYDNSEPYINGSGRDDDSGAPPSRDTTLPPTSDAPTLPEKNIQVMAIPRIDYHRTPTSGLWNTAFSSKKHRQHRRRKGDSTSSSSSSLRKWAKKEQKLFKDWLSEAARGRYFTSDRKWKKFLKQKARDSLLEPEESLADEESDNQPAVPPNSVNQHTPCYYSEQEENSVRSGGQQIVSSSDSSHSGRQVLSASWRSSDHNHAATTQNDEMEVSRSVTATETNVPPLNLKEVRPHTYSWGGPHVSATENFFHSQTSPRSECCSYESITIPPKVLPQIAAQTEDQTSPKVVERVVCLDIAPAAPQEDTNRSSPSRWTTTQSIELKKLIDEEYRELFGPPPHQPPWQQRLSRARAFLKPLLTTSNGPNRSFSSAHRTPPTPIKSAPRYRAASPPAVYNSNDSPPNTTPADWNRLLQPTKSSMAKSRFVINLPTSNP